MQTRVRLTLTTACHQGPEEDSTFYAAHLLEEAINSRGFNEFVLNFPNFKQCSESNAQIYERLMSGATTLQPSPDRTIDIYLGFHFKNSRVIGYTNPSTLWQYANRHHFNAAAPWKLAGNLAHEYCHKAGYDHSFNPSPEWPQTVPYAIGNWIEYEAELIARADKDGIINGRERFGIRHLRQWVSPGLASWVDETQIANAEPTEGSASTWPQ